MFFFFFKALRIHQSGPIVPPWTPLCEPHWLQELTAAITEKAQRSCPLCQSHGITGPLFQVALLGAVHTPGPLLRDCSWISEEPRSSSFVSASSGLVTLTSLLVPSIAAFSKSPVPEALFQPVLLGASL